jgi:hypothetical protein
MSAAEQARTAEGRAGESPASLDEDQLAWLIGVTLPHRSDGLDYWRMATDVPNRGAGAALKNSSMARNLDHVTVPRAVLELAAQLGTTEMSRSSTSTRAIPEDSSEPQRTSRLFPRAQAMTYRTLSFAHEMRQRRAPHHDRSMEPAPE